MQIIPDITALYQFGIFILAFILMNVLIFRPIMRILARRQELTEEAREASQALQGQTEEMIQKYSLKIQEARGEGQGIKENIKKEGEAQAKQVLEQTRSELEQSAESARQEIAQEASSASQQLQSQAQQLSAEMAEKLLGRKVAS